MSQSAQTSATQRKIQPSLFISHGSPELILQDTPAKHFYCQLADQLAQDTPRPDAIIVISAHWETPAPIVGITASANPEIIYDFYGFQDALYKMEYPAPGEPQLAEKIQQLLGKNNIDARLHPTRGLDHGVWSPLKLIYPEADIPVIQVSIPRGVPESFYWQLGQTLQPLRSQNCLIIASGAATHNLNYFRQAREPLQPVMPMAEGFINWLNNAVTTGDRAALENYLQAPYGQDNHPSPEHYLPLLVAAGAGTQAQGEIIHDSVEYGFLSMACYRWD
jgi:4,5-DOPA dioxygenase extradiol